MNNNEATDAEKINTLKEGDKNMEMIKTKTKKKKQISYLDPYRERIEELLSKGVGIASIARLLRSETNIPIPYVTLIGYIKRNNMKS